MEEQAKKPVRKKKKLKKLRSKTSKIQFRASGAGDPLSSSTGSAGAELGRTTSRSAEPSSKHHHRHPKSKSHSRHRSSHHRRHHHTHSHEPSHTKHPGPNNKGGTEVATTSTAGKFSDNYKIVAHDKQQSKKFVHIHKCQHLATNKVYSVKIVNRQKSSRWNKQLPIFVEIESLRLWHQLPENSRILPLYGWYDGDNHTYFITDEALSFPSTKTLREALGMDNTGLKQGTKWIVTVLKQILDGLQYLHEENQIVHGDMRPDHVVLIQPETPTESNPVQVKLKGLGACGKINDPASTALLDRQISHYTAPELGNNLQTMQPKPKTVHTIQPSLDVWSVGVICFVLLAVRLPPHPESAANATEYQYLLEHDALWKNPHVPPAAQEFVSQCLQWDATQRWTTQQALQHAFLNAGGARQHISLKRTNTKGANLRVVSNNQMETLLESQPALSTKQAAIPENYTRGEKSNATAVTEDSSSCDEFFLEIVSSTDKDDNDSPNKTTLTTVARTKHMRPKQHPQQRARDPLRFSSINFSGHQDQHTKFYKQYRIIQDLNSSMVSSSSQLKAESSHKTTEWYACRHRKTGVERIVKIVERSSRWIAQDPAIYHCRREFHTISSQLQHASILRVHELFEGEQHYFLVMEYAVRNLENEIDTFGSLPEPVAQQVMKQLLSCVAYLQDRSCQGAAREDASLCWVHRNIRPESIVLEGSANLLRGRNRIKLTNFGRASRYNFFNGELLDDREPTNESDDGDKYDNSDEFVAPEARGNAKSFRPASDVYACGMLAHWMLRQRYPKSEKIEFNLSKLKAQEPTPKLDWEGVSQLARDFILRLTTSDVGKRLSAKAALEHPWIARSTEDASAVTTGHTLGWHKALVLSRFNGEAHVQFAIGSLLAAQIETNRAMEMISRVYKDLGLSLKDRLSTQQVQDAYHGLVRRQLPQEEVDAMFFRVDVDQGGFLEGVELLVACLNELGLVNTSPLKKAYDYLVTRQNSMVQNADLCRMLSSFRGTSHGISEGEVQGLLQTMIKGYAAHGDGDISLDDVQGMIVKVAIAEFSAWNISESIQNLRGAALVRCGKMKSVAFTSTQGANVGLTLMDDYLIGQYISHGMYACNRKSSGGSKHILKIADISHRASKAEEIMHEVAILNGLAEQPNVALVNDVFEDESSIYVVLDNYGDGGTLVDELETFGRLSETEAALFLKKLLDCVNFCHEMNVAHRDLKPEIIMLSKYKDITEFKIGDFSSAAVCDPEVGLKGRYGTPGYMAPEVAKGRYGTKCDLWSVGVIAYLSMAKTISFQMFIADVKQLVKTGKFTFTDPSWNAVSALGKDFIASLLTFDQKERPSATEALAHEWLEAAREHAVAEENQALRSAGNVVLGPKMQQAAMMVFRCFLALKQERQALDRLLKPKGFSADSHLSKENVKEAYQAYFDKELGEDALEDMFLRIDMDGIRKISYSNFVIAVMNEKGLIGSEQVVKAYSLFDVDDTGLISTVHLKIALAGLPLEILDEEAASTLLNCLERQPEQRVSVSGFLQLLLQAEGIAVPSSGQSESAVEGMRFNSLAFINNKSRRLEEVYEIGAFVNEGLFGKVFLCKHKKTGAVRAVKVRKETIWEENAKLVQAEIEVLKTLDHPNVIPLLDLFVESGHYCIVSYFMEGGDLCTELDDNGNMSEDRAAELLRHLLGVVHYLHERKVLHRDIKPDNIMFPKSKSLGQFKLIDFARAAMCEEDERLMTLVTTPEYAAPEVVSKCYGHKADCFACGVTLYLCLSNTFPFDGDTREEIYERIQEGEYVVLEEVSTSGFDLVSRLLTYDEDYRPTAAKALEHQWFREMSPSAESTQAITSDVQEALDNLRSKQLVAPSKLKQATHALIAAQGLLQREKEDIDRAFLAIDANHDGKLSKKEVQDGYAAYFGQPLSDEEVHQMFAQLDVDGTGFLEYSEFVVAAMNEQDLLKSGKLRRAFDAFDVDNSGGISKEDLKMVLKEALQKGKATNDEVVTQLIDQVDLDGDGVISFEEFTSMMLMSTE